MAAELNDDLILEIVKRLPLKYEVRCSVLNKNICRRIFEPNFLPSYSTIFHRRHQQHGSKIFTRFLEEIRFSNSTTVYSIRHSVTLDVDVSIITSCNGLLLLRFQNPNSYYIFNPTTSAVMPVDHDAIGSSTAVGLAAPNNSRFNSGSDLDGSSFRSESDNSGFKLVTAAEISASSDKTRLKIKVIVPSLTDSGESTLVKSRVFDFDRRFELFKAEAVYAHGSLYWLGNAGRVMAAFDVEKEEVRLIDGPVPVESGGLWRWHGFVDGSFHLVYRKPPFEFVICRHDHFTGEWGVKHRVSNIFNPKTKSLFMSILVLFDGRRLFFTRNPIRGRGDTLLTSYDVENGVWKRIGSLVDDELQFFSYTSSLVKVSDMYLGGSFWKYGEGLRRDLLKVQELLRPRDEIFTST